MNIYEQITADIKEAMLEKNTVKRDCLRSLVSEIKNKTVNEGKEITEQIVISCVKKAAKQRVDSVECFKAGNRPELAEKETEELGYILKYMPKTLSEDETKIVIENILQNIEATKKNFGLIMKQLPLEVDKKLASKILNMMLK